MKTPVLLTIFFLLFFISCSSTKTAEDDLASAEAFEDDTDFVASDEVEEMDVEAIGTGNYAEYTVKENDTLMLIAFNLYGDYLKWRNIYDLNKDQLEGRSLITPGMVLKYEVMEEQFSWNPEGTAYLILRGDTLGKIANKVYGDMSQWQYIWDNNKPMIKDPNLIFAGFTLYYLPLEQVTSL